LTRENEYKYAILMSNNEGYNFLGPFLFDVQIVRNKIVASYFFFFLLFPFNRVPFLDDAIFAALVLLIPFFLSPS